MIKRWIINYWIELLLIVAAIVITNFSIYSAAILFVVWYWIGEGATEGYTWASDFRRTQNIFIKPGKYDVSINAHFKGRWCYHTWRAIGEDVGIFASLILFVILAQSMQYSIINLIISYIGANFIGIFFYERVFNHIVYNKIWPQKRPWDCLNGLVVITRKPWHDLILLVIGVILLIIAN